MKIGVGRLCLLLVIVAALPGFAHAQVVINEAMYDPPGTDSGQEWIELYNAGASPVDLTKWTFNDGGPNTTKHVFNAPPKNGGIGSITIPAGGYLIVADDAATFEAAYPSALNVIDSTMNMPDPNAGVSATLTLYDDQKNAADTFTYTGGTNADNKGDSIQRLSSGTDVIAAVPTPGAQNATTTDTSSSSNNSGGSSDATTTDTQTQTQTQTTPAPASSYVAPPSPSLFTDVGPDRVVIVGADTQFDARAYDKQRNVLDAGTVRFMWNFGDGQTAEGESVLHHYEYPGRYALVLNIAQDRFAGVDEAIITAEPAKLAFSALPDGGVEIDNLAGRDLDLSGWLVRAGAGLFPALFTLPPHSVILSGSSMHITKTTLGFAATSQAELQYPNGVEALQAGETTSNTSPPALPGAPAPVPTTPSPQVRSTAATASSGDSGPAEANASPDAADVPTTTAETAAAGSASPASSKMWWLAAGGLAAAAGGSLVAARRFGKKKWDIVEEK